ncbi:hypothetical protein MesoLjLc_51720 [Mesorhizobium sp. L-8-10]|uniref:hypothetical protein n=1 Tax=Mesorhizobium sp. L-8-10 TaxID=2744523 RepID=UPI0019281197|nr:hypothetical protein [Mesorhizobium sp. L-8-10]BCH33242.1 hypothetical protein MesoLjLc_51720 [Mesorhizobium sp. L-8-10]
MYDYVRDHYSFKPVIGRRVMHDETRKEGVITPEDRSQGHYVQVRFDGSNFSLPCHPGSLVYVDAAP